MNVDVRTANSYSLTVQHGSTDYADSTSYFFGSIYDQGAATGGAVRRVYVPVAGKIIAVYGFVLVGGTTATNENSTLSIRLNDTTDTEVTDALKFDAVSTTNFNKTSLSITVAAGDFIEMKLETPAFSTNPTVVFLHGTLVVEV